MKPEEEESFGDVMKYMLGGAAAVAALILVFVVAAFVTVEVASITAHHVRVYLQEHWR